MSTPVNRLSVEADPEALTKILSNLLINAFKFTGTQVKVTVDESAMSDPGKRFFAVSVEDDGPGIPQEDIAHIFKKFIKVSSGNGQYDNLGGTGIGLALAKSLTEKHGGRLEVSSIPHEKTIFKVLIPYTTTPGQSPEVPAAAQPEHQQLSRGAVILVVEDDIGMNNFLVNSLRAEGYDVLTAFNGKEALQLIENQSVDLVLSDVMMPETDGLTLCKQIKEDTNYSHLPVVLLTAKGNSDAEMTGIENGADAYIVKPFKLKYVLARVRNLLESRERLRRKFALYPVIDGESLTTNSRDKQFIEKVTGIIEERMRDPQLSVEELSSAMAMSRSNLHKKLKGLSGYVPNEFIRLIRLKHAAKLMMSNQYNISEIVYLVGFNSHSYFSKCFAQQFQMTPKEFIEKQATQVGE